MDGGNTQCNDVSYDKPRQELYEPQNNSTVATNSQCQNVTVQETHSESKIFGDVVETEDGGNFRDTVGETASSTKDKDVHKRSTKIIQSDNEHGPSSTTTVIMGDNETNASIKKGKKKKRQKKRRVKEHDHMDYEVYLDVDSRPVSKYVEEKSLPTTLKEDNYEFQHTDSSSATKNFPSRLWLGVRQERDAVSEERLSTGSNNKKFQIDNPTSHDVLSHYRYKMFSVEQNYKSDLFTINQNHSMQKSQLPESGIRGENKMNDKSGNVIRKVSCKKKKKFNLKRTSAKVSIVPETPLPPISSRLELDPTARTVRSGHVFLNSGDRTSGDQTSGQNESTVFPDPLTLCRLITKFPLTYFFSLTIIHVAIFGISVGLVFTGYDVFPAVFDDLPLYIYNNVRLQELSWRSRNNYEGYIYRPVYGFSINTGFRGSIKDTVEVIYEKPGVNILTAQHLQWIKAAEDRLYNEATYQADFCLLDHNYRCVKPQSLLRLFDGTYSHIDSVFLDPDFSNLTHVLYKASVYNETRQYLKLFLGKDSVITPKRSYTTITRSFYFMGWPLWSVNGGGFGTQADIANYLADVFKPEIEKIRDYLLVERFDVYYLSKLLYEHDLVEQALTDLKLAIGSFLFIFVFMCVQTGFSLVVTFLGIFSVLSSFLLTNLVYRYVFQFKYFGFFHVIAIFLILGIGADDLFVFYDTWRLTGHTVYPSDAHRLSDCYRRAAKTTFVTSFTTAMAFLVSGLSPLLPVKTFGIFTGILVALNYFWVVLYFPSIIMIHHTRTKLWWHKFHRSVLYIWLGEKISDYNGVDHSSTSSHDTNSLSETNSAKELLSDANGHSVTSAGSTGKRPPSPRHGYESQVERQSQVSVHIEDSKTSKNAKIHLKQDLEVGESEHATARKLYIRNKFMKPKKNFEDRNRIVKFLRNTFFDFMTKRIVKVLVPLLFLGVSIFFIHKATLLEPDTNQLRLFRNNHNYAKASTRHYFSFLRNQDEEYQRVYMVWGILPADISQCDQKSAEYCFGTPQFDADFDMNTAEAQLAFKRLCQQLENLSPELVEKLHIQRHVSTGKPKIACFTKDFEQYFKDKVASDWRLPSTMTLSLPVSPGNVSMLMASNSIVYRRSLPTDFNNYFEILVAYWLTDGYQLNPTKDYFAYNGLLAEKKVDGVTKPAYGIDYGLYYGSRLQFLAIEVNTTLNIYSLGYQEGLPVYSEWENFISSINKEMPSPLKRGMQVTESLWHWLHVQETLASSAVTGILIGLLTVWPILILTTMNLIIGTIATVTIGLVTACVVGLIPLAGWKLGVLESINLCMVVGLSVDYIVHLAEAYRLSESHTRSDRVRHMLESIGLSVISGAITTMGAAVFMLFAQIQFFFQFGIFILSTVGISLLFSLLGFTTFLSLVGPEHNTGSLLHMAKGLIKFCRPRVDSDTESRDSCSKCPCAPPSVLVDRFYDWLSYCNNAEGSASARRTKPGRLH